MSQDNFLTTLSQWFSIETVGVLTLQGRQFSFSKKNNVNFTDKEEWMPKPQELPRWISVCGEFSSTFTKAVCQHFPWSY